MKDLLAGNLEEAARKIEPGYASLLLSTDKVVNNPQIMKSVVSILSARAKKEKFKLLDVGCPWPMDHLVANRDYETLTLLVNSPGTRKGRKRP